MSRRDASRETTLAGLVSFTPEGLWCEAGGFHIDPWRPVDRALITHAHSDHARPGHGHYLSTPGSAPVITHRLGVRPETVAYGEKLSINGVTVSFHPAGHVPGSAQIRLEHRGEVWVVSGDYKVAPDGLSEPFEPVRCHTFITECTFGLPVFNWAEQAEIVASINDWWRACADEGRVAMIGAYAFGKAQRILAHVDSSIGPILTHGAVEAVNQVLRASGVALPPTTPVTPDLPRQAMARALVIAPPSALSTPWAGRFGKPSQAIASGWMALRGVRRRSGAERGFVMSDHADWTGLNGAVTATGASRIFATHGYTAIFRRWLEEKGLEAGIVETEFEGESLERGGEGE